MNKKWSFLEIIIVLSFLMMVLITFFGVVTRYIFNRPLIFNEELARILLIIIVLIGATVNSRDKNQLSVDVFYDLLFSSSRIKKTVDFIINSIVVIALVALIYYGILLMFISQKQYTTVLGIPFPIVYSIIPFSSLIILIYHFKEIVSYLKNIKLK